MPIIRKQVARRKKTVKKKLPKKKYAAKVAQLVGLWGMVLL